MEIVVMHDYYLQKRNSTSYLAFQTFRNAQFYQNINICAKVD